MVSAVNDDSPEAQASAPKQTLLSLVGTIVFNLYSFAIRVFGGPPLLPWGSTVTVRSSKLEIDCGDGYDGARGLVRPGRGDADPADLSAARGLVDLALAALPGFTEAGDLSASDRYFAEDLTEPFVLEDGELSVPDGAGIGVTPPPIGCASAQSARSSNRDPANLDHGEHS